MFLKNLYLVNNFVNKGLFVTILFAAIFGLNAQTSPTVILTDTDTDNLLSASDTVTITATFSEAMVATPTISISGVSSITNIAMLKSAGIFHQIGNSINGRGKDDYANLVAMSSDGSTVAVHYQKELEDLNGNGSNDEAFKVFRYQATSNSWNKIGEDIRSHSAFEDDKNISFSSNGNILAIGIDAPNQGGDPAAGVVSVYSYDSNSNSWNQLGPSFEGQGESHFQSRVSLSADGTRLAIGAHRFENGQTLEGSLKIFDYTPSGTSSWTQLGPTLEGNNDNRNLGKRVVISADGSTVAALCDETSGMDDKFIIVYRYTPSGTSSWTQLGLNRDLEEHYWDSTYFGKAISLTSDGNQIAIGETDGRTANDKPGIVKVYSYDSNSNSWDQLGTSIEGETDGDFFGIVDMSSDGTKLVIGAPEYNNNQGYVKYYEYTPTGTSSWTQYGETLYGDTGDRFGNMVKISGDGSRFAVAALYMDGAFTDEGEVKIFNTGDQYQYKWDVSQSGSLSDGNYTATVAGTASETSIAYSGTDSITFTLDTTAPTVTLTDTDSDNIVTTSEVVTITAGFSEAMTATPTISITGIVTNVIMTPVSGTNSYTYRWDTSSGTLTTGNYAATVSGTDLIGNAYVAGTQSITFTVDSSTPTVTITTSDSDNTLKPGDQITITATFSEAMASGPSITIGSAVSNAALTATSSTTFTYSWSTSGVSGGSYTVTVTGTDLAGNTYAGSDKITITLDSTAPTVTLSDTDDDNLLAASDTVTITADFDEAMTSTPTISIAGTSISNQVMTKIIGGSGSGPGAQLGADIDGELVGDFFGLSASLSSDGSRVAIGAPFNDEFGTNSGHIRIYDYTPSGTSSWTQVGDDIDGETENEQSGQSVSISSDGSRVAIGAMCYGRNTSQGCRGRVRIYELQSGNWVQLGVDIDGEADGDFNGISVSLSSDGSRVAIGANNNDGTTGNGSDNRGHVRIFDYTPSGTSSWTQVGGDIDGEAAVDGSGVSVSISSDGSRVAIGAFGNDGNRGHVRVFKYQVISGTATWTQLGQDIDGEAAGDFNGISVSLSSDGSRVAIGANNNDGANGADSGHVRVYDYNGTAWVQVGEDIDGEAADDNSGGVSLSSDGSRVAIAAKNNDGANGANSGHVRIYDYNGAAWVQVGLDIDGEAAEDNSGFSVSLSSDGSIVAIGAPFNDGNGSNSGHVRVYSLPRGETYQYAWDVDSGIAPSDGTYRATVAGSDLAGNAYSGTDSITFTLDTTAPTVTLTDTDSDNVVNVSQVVTITAGFSEVMTATPTISITGIATNVVMSIVGYTVTDPVVFNVTVANSWGNKYFIDGQSQLSLNLVSGQTYRFDQSDSSNSGHPISFSTTNDGTHNSGSAYTTNVTSVGTPGQSGAYTLITIPSNGPSKLYYYCTNHSSMGGDINKGIGYYYRWDTSSGTLTTGNYAATVSGTDSIGNAYVAGTQSITFTVDSSAPTVTITSSDSDNTVKDADSPITVTATFNEAMASAPTISISGVVTNAALTATSNTTWTYDWNISSVTEGSYTVTVTGTDLAGNTYSGTDSITLTVDNTAPGVLLVSDNTDPIIGSTGVVSISAYFSESLSTSPTLSISGLVTNTVMSKFSSTPIKQIGQVIFDSAGSMIGFTSDISESGNRIIVGGPYGSDRSFARVYQWNGKQWEQLGNDIIGTSSNDLGRPVGISGDGSVIVVGERGTADNNFIYKIYTLSGSSWALRETLNDNNTGTLDNTENGSVDFSYDGSIIALSHGLHDNAKGRARIFEWNNTNYIQMGSDILGSSSNSMLGSGWNGISLTKDGKRIVVGLRTNQNSVGGKVRVYDWDGSVWTQVGGDITDPAGTALSFGSSVSISNDGQTIIAGAPDIQNSTTGGPGQVLIFSYQLISGTASWTYKATIAGSINGDYFGYSSSINGNGDKIIVGAYNANSMTGYARLYKWDGTTASQIGSDIVGGNNHAFGAHVELSANGLAVIGAPLSDSGGPNSGEVKVIGIDRYEYSWDVDGGGVPSDGTYYATVAGADLASNNYAGTESITFTLDATAPTVTLTDTDSDNLVSASEVVTITAGFSEAMTATPTISITGIATNVVMSIVGYTVTDPVVFNVTVANSWGNKYFIDGQSQLSLNLVSGQTYRFDQSDSSNSGHPISFSTTNDGTHNSGSAYTTNVTSVGTPGQSGAYTLITIPSNGPSNLYYYCANHPSMGGDITKGIGYYYRWDTSSGTLTTGNYAATVSGTDSIGNAYAAGTQSITFTVDTTSPTLTITTPSGPKVSNSSIVVTLTYNEAVTGLTTDTSQFSAATNVASLELLSASSDGKTYTLRINPTGEGLVKLTHAPGSPPVKDLAGNSIASTVSCSFTYDTSGPTVTFSDTDDDNLLAASDTVTITASFNEGMTATPTISISGTSISGQRMTKISGGASGTGSATQIGGDIDGEAVEDYSGESVSFSSDGLRVAIGASMNDGNGSNSGHVRIYDYNGSAWAQVGQDIDGEAGGDYSGKSISLSSDGSRVAIGATNNDGGGSISGHVRIYDYNGSAWVQVGADINGEAAFNYNGHSVSLSSDGSRIAIGATRNNGGGSDSGHVRIYDYNGSAWVQVGSDINGEATDDRSGFSVSLSSDGSIVAVGAYNNDGAGNNSGHVRIYQYNNNSWSQLGADIDGEAAGDSSGRSVSLSSDGSRLAIGAYSNDGAGNNSGHVRIYQYNNNSWSQLGADIDGEAAGDSSHKVSLSSDGSRVAIGAEGNDGGGTDSGHVRIYDYNGSAWVQIGSDINGEAADDRSGFSVSLSSDG